MRPEEFAEEERAVLRGTAEMFRALGDAVRLRAMVRLAEGGSLSIAELTEGTGVTRQAVAKHLRVLEQVGVVESRVQGRERLYELDGEPLSEAIACLDMVSAGWKRMVGLEKRVEGPMDRDPNALTRRTLRKSAASEEVHRVKEADDLSRRLST